MAKSAKPNILVIMADDIGIWNISAYHRGMMGGRTPNIDRIAQEGALFTDYYSQQSCTAGRASFITGQHPFRIGLLKVGMPGAKQGLQDKDPTIAELLKPHGYATAQIGKNHLGDRNEYLPTVHGFDEFFGNLYHLNAEEEPEDPDYPSAQKYPNFRNNFGPRGLLDCKATDKDDATEDPRFGRVGKQTIKDTGPITRKRMQTVEEELLARSFDFIDRNHKSGTPFFLWHNTTRMHAFTRLSPEWENKSGYGLYADGMMELDHVVGELLKKLDDLGIADNTIVLFTSDNGAEVMSWPDGGNTPFKGEKGTTWEGGMRVPGAARWPGVIKPGTIVNDVISQEDWLPTFLAAAGDPDMKENLMKGMKVGAKTFKTHLDGYNFLPFFRGETGTGPRQEIFYFDDNASLNAVRVDDWKIHFKVMIGNLAEATLKPLNMPQVINLRQDPFERFPAESHMYFRWWADKLWTFVPVQMIVGRFLQTFKEFPPSQKSGSFSVDHVLAPLTSPGGTGDGRCDEIGDAPISSHTSEAKRARRDHRHTPGRRLRHQTPAVGRAQAGLASRAEVGPRGIGVSSVILANASRRHPNRRRLNSRSRRPICRIVIPILQERVALSRADLEILVRPVTPAPGKGYRRATLTSTMAEAANSSASTKSAHRSRVGIWNCAKLNGAPLLIVKLVPTALAHTALIEDVLAPAVAGVSEMVKVYGKGVDANVGDTPEKGIDPDGAGSVKVVSRIVTPFAVSTSRTTRLSGGSVQLRVVPGAAVTLVVVQVIDAGAPEKEREKA